MFTKKDRQMKILLKTYIRRVFTPQFHSDWIGGDRKTPNRRLQRRRNA
jgi:hypothetical protein